MSAAVKLNATSALMDKDFVNAFIQAVINTHKITANVSITAGKPKVLPKIEKHGEISGFVGIVSSDTKWVLSLSYDKKSAVKIYHALFGEAKDELDHDVCDLIGEITNQVYGGAKLMLNQRGYSFQMALPTVISGDFRTHHHGAGATLSIPFKFSDSEDEIYVDITLEK
jgi:chemotaxis protein CheX